MRAFLRALLGCAVFAGGVALVRSEEPLPPPPKAHFNDYAGLLSPAEAQRLDHKLNEFETQTSTQIVVAVFPRLPAPSLEDFTVRTAQSWRVGQQKVYNGAVLFVFVEDRKMRIETGYGLEGALPDALAARILDDEVRPRFRGGDWAGGLEAGIDAMMAATRGEYTAKPRASPGSSPVALVILVVFVLLFLWLASRGSRYVSTGRTYGGGGWHTGGWGGGGFSGGDWGGGGGFSGGGGSFGGGGASSSW